MEIKLNQYLVPLFLVLGPILWKYQILYPRYFLPSPPQDFIRWTVPIFSTIVKFLKKIYNYTLLSSFIMIVKYQMVLLCTFTLKFFFLTVDSWKVFIKFKLNQYSVSLFGIWSHILEVLDTLSQVLPTFTTVGFYQMDGSFFFQS